MGRVGNGNCGPSAQFSKMPPIYCGYMLNSTIWVLGSFPFFILLLDFYFLGVVAEF